MARDDRSVLSLGVVVLPLSEDASARRTAGGGQSEDTIQVWPWEGCRRWGRGGFWRRAGWTWEVGLGPLCVHSARVHVVATEEADGAGWRHVGEPSGGGGDEGRPLGRWQVTAAGKGSRRGAVGHRLHRVRDFEGVLLCGRDGGGPGPRGLGPACPKVSQEAPGLPKDFKDRHNTTDEQYRPGGVLKRKYTLEG